MSKKKFKHILKSLRYPTMSFLSKKGVSLGKWLKTLNWATVIYVTAMVVFVSPTAGELISNAIHNKLAPVDLYRFAIFMCYVLIVVSKFMIDHYKRMFEDMLHIAEAQQQQIAVIKKLLDSKLGGGSFFSTDLTDLIKSKKPKKEDEDLKN